MSLKVNGSVAVKGSIRGGTRLRGMLMATRLSEMSIIQLLLMHLVLFSSCYLFCFVLLEVIFVVN